MNKDIIGVGIQAIAYTHDKHPDSVIKTTSITGENDPAYQSLRLFYNHQDNPFFPKIYTYKVYPTRTLSKEEIKFLKSSHKLTLHGVPRQKEFTLVVVMERLKPILSITDEEILKLFDELGVIKYKGDIDEFIRYKRIIRNRFENPYEREMLRLSPNKQFAQAIRLLEPLFRHHDADMHFGNLMLRGKQLVIMDPIT